MITNWVTNRKMNELLNDTLNLLIEDSLEMKLEQLEKLFFPPFKQVKNCVIISEKSVDRLEEAFDKVIEQMYMDRTGYEAHNTETRINCFFENEISIGVGIKIAVMVLEIWILQLKRIEPQSHFCMIISSDENYVEIRFHKMHSGEKMWLSDNLENYKDEAVGYVII